MADSTQNSYLDRQHARRDEFQSRKVVLESGRIAQNDWLEYVRAEDDSKQATLPIVSVSIFTHDGGLTNTVNDNWNVSAGDTIIFEVWDPMNADQDTFHTLAGGGRTEIIHALAGGTDTAYTATQVAASINNDAALSAWVYAAAENTADRVTVYPRGPMGRVRVTGGTAQDVIVFPGTEVDNADRVFTLADVATGTDWTLTYDADTKAVRVTRDNATAAESVTVVISLH